MNNMISIFRKLMLKLGYIHIDKLREVILMQDNSCIQMAIGAHVFGRRFEPGWLTDPKLFKDPISPHWHPLYRG